MVIRVPKVTPAAAVWLAVLLGCGAARSPTPKKIIEGSATSPPPGASSPKETSALPPEVIQRVVRQAFPRFRLCYENGLRHHADLRGIVVTRFIIGLDGTVTRAAAVPPAGWQLPPSPSRPPMPDPAVTACVVKVITELQYPRPDGRVVAVVYPIFFSAGDSKPDVGNAQNRGEAR